MTVTGMAATIAGDAILRRIDHAFEIRLSDKLTSEDMFWS